MISECKTDPNIMNEINTIVSLVSDLFLNYHIKHIMSYYCTLNLKLQKITKSHKFLYIVISKRWPADNSHSLPWRMVLVFDN